jgi:hypothetical protein
MFGTAVPTYLTDEQFDAVDREFTRQETKIEVVE